MISYDTECVSEFILQSKFLGCIATNMVYSSDERIARNGRLNIIFAKNIFIFVNNESFIRRW